MYSEENNQLVDHRSKCRCCFKSPKKIVEISKSIEKRFQAVTNLELVMSDTYSSIICESCNSRLSEFSDFQSELIEHQVLLYNHTGLYMEEVLTEVTGDEEKEEEHYEVIPEEYSQELMVVRVPELEETEQTVITNIAIEIDDTSNQNSLQEKSTIDRDSKNRMMCPFCGLSFSKKAWYHHKLRVHSDGFRFICDFCNKGFHIKNDLKDHIKIHMSVESRKRFPCSSCGTLLLSIKALQNHEQIFHSDVVEEHPCECGKVFSTKPKLCQHRSTVHKDETYSCDRCLKVYCNKSSLKKHTIKVHGKKVPCDICGKMFAPGMFMNRHIKQSHEPPQFKCTYEDCTKAFTCKSWLKTHLESHEPTVLVYCSSCNASYNSVRNLNRHVARQHSTYKIKCEVAGCSHSTARKDYLTAHYRSHKDIDEETRKKLLEKVKSIKAISW